MTIATSSATSSVKTEMPLSAEELRKIHAYWRAANYLAVGDDLPQR